MACQKCESDRVLDIKAKSNDCCIMDLYGVQHVGYAPRIDGISGGDYIKTSICLDCGQVQGTFPKPITELEK